MSPKDRTRRWTHRVHVPAIHVPHMLPERRLRWHISSRGYWIIGLVAGFLALYLFLLILAYLQGSGVSDVEPMRYFWP